MRAYRAQAGITPEQQNIQLQGTIAKLEADVAEYKRQRNVVAAIAGISGIGLAAAVCYWWFNKHAQISVHAATGNPQYFQTYTFDMPLLTVWRYLGKTIVVTEYVNKILPLPTQTS